MKTLNELKLKMKSDLVLSKKTQAQTLDELQDTAYRMVEHTESAITDVEYIIGDLEVDIEDIKHDINLTDVDDVELLKKFARVNKELIESKYELAELKESLETYQQIHDLAFGV
ncbi:hypothetical protein [Vibrio sp. 10N.222.52.B7]|uniref:hypothetical protein n=1 Tax=Vibrio sp. 10N.222.52.B7 TaxID=3229629 RepID=UPI00354DA207